MRQILTNSRAEDAGLGFKQADARVQAMNFQTNKSTDRQDNMVALRDSQSVLSTLNASELFKPTMIDFDLPSVQSMESCFFDARLAHGLARLRLKLTRERVQVEGTR